MHRTRIQATQALAVGDEEINLTPMLDVVFILLIFFVVTASFIRESGLAVNGSGNEARLTTDAEAIVVTLDAGNGYRIDNLSVQAGSLRPQLAALHALDAKLPLVIQAAAGSSVQALIRVLDAAEAVGIDDIAVVRSAEYAP